MILTNKLRLAISKYAYLETFIVSSLAFLIGYMFDVSDPLLLQSEIIYIILVLAVITLFHGMSNGLVALLVLSVYMKLFYAEFPTREFLHLLMLALILGEFHYYWNRKIIQNTSKNTYLRIKLDELSNAFYTLKISHDQLEKNYVFKPMSLRNSIRLIKEAYAKEEDYYTEFLTLLQKSFNVSDAQLCYLTKGKLYDVADKSASHPIDMGDPMIEMAIAKQSPMYVSSQEVQNNSRYLAVIPAVTDEKIKGMLLIRKMPFLSFNKDTLITISVLIAYFLDELEKWKTIRLEQASSLIVKDDFAFELKRLYRLFTEYQVESTVLIIKTKDELLSHLIIEMIQKNLRSLDLLSSHRSSDTYVTGILFPFADDAAAQGFFNRLLLLLKLQADDERMEVSFFDISEITIIQRYAEIEYDIV